MRVLVLSNMYPGKRSATFGIFVKNQVEALRKKGWTVDVVAVQDPRMGARFALPKYVKWLSKGLWTLLLKGRRYDVVHVHYVFPTGLLGLLAKRYFKSKLIVTAHGGDIDRMARINGTVAHYTQTILNQADHVIAVGEQLKTDLIEDFDLESDKITVLNMGVKREVFHPMDRDMAKQKLGLNPNQTHILFIGNIIQAKGVEELLEAFLALREKRPEVRLHLMGLPKQPGFAERMKAYAQREGDGSITFYPPQPQADLAVWMNACEVFVLPSHIEGFGLVALEAMSCRVPVIGTEVGGLKHLLGDGRGLLVPPKDSKALTKAMETCLEDPELYKQLVEKGEQQALLYSEDRIIERLSEIYQR